MNQRMPEPNPERFPRGPAMRFCSPNAACIARLPSNRKAAGVIAVGWQPVQQWHSANGPPGRLRGCERLMRLRRQEGARESGIPRFWGRALWRRPLLEANRHCAVLQVPILLMAGWPEGMKLPRCAAGPRPLHELHLHPSPSGPPLPSIISGAGSLSVRPLGSPAGHQGMGESGWSGFRLGVGRGIGTTWRPIPIGDGESTSPRGAREEAWHFL
jgi:hypothetical protein